MNGEIEYWFFSGSWVKGGWDGCYCQIDKIMEINITTVSPHHSKVYSFRSKANTKYLYHTQLVSGEWKDWKKTAILDLDKVTGVGYVFFEISGEGMWGLVAGGSQSGKYLTAHGRMDTFLEVVNRMFLYSYVYKGKHYGIH